VIVQAREAAFADGLCQTSSRSAAIALLLAISEPRPFGSIQKCRFGLLHRKGESWLPALT